MKEQDEIFIASSLESGNKYGYPKCCIDEFVAITPSMMQKMKPTKTHLLRVEMSMVNGKYSGFFPCENHAKMIKEKKITLGDLIDYKKREDPMPFPHGWSYK